jgi:hypothetical protein
MMPYFVSRQCYQPNGEFRVEIAGGGRDYANPGMLVPKYERWGEGQEFVDPIDAVEAAVAVLAAWRKDSITGKRKLMLAQGHTMGMTMPFEACTIKQARKWAAEVRKCLERCVYCDNVLGAKTWSHELEDGKFCSERCAEDDREWHMKQDGADLEDKP